MRAFVSLNPDPPAMAAVEQLMERLRKAMQFAGMHPAWVPPSNLHFTLQFLGDEVPGDPTHVQAICNALDAALSELPPLELNAESLGCFPNVKQPNVLWLGLQRRCIAPVDLLARNIGAALRPLGYRPDAQPFQPHLTLARFRSMRGTHALPNLLQSQRQFARVSFQFAHVSLMQSDLSGKTPVHTELHRAPLAGKPR